MSLFCAILQPLTSNLYRASHGGGAASAPALPVNTLQPILVHPDPGYAPGGANLGPIGSLTSYDGDLVGVTTGEWTSGSPVTYTYQWYLDAVLLSGETSDTYAVYLNINGGLLACEVTATNSGGAATLVTTEWTINITPRAPINVDPPLIGDLYPLHPGDLVGVYEGTWQSDTVAGNYTYQWYLVSEGVSGDPIVGATEQAYAVPDTAFGLSLTCEVTLSNTVGSTSVMSALYYVDFPLYQEAAAEIDVDYDGLPAEYVAAVFSQGGVIFYQWYHFGVAIEGATSNILTGFMLSEGDEFYLETRCTTQWYDVSGYSNTIYYVPPVA